MNSSTQVTWALITVFSFSLTVDYGNAVADDLADAEVIKVLRRLAEEGRRKPVRVERLYEADTKNRIVKLKLGKAKLKSGDFAILTKLESLDLSRSNISDDQLKKLRAFPKLSDLKLYQTRISGQGLRHLRMMVQLEKLDLGRTRIDNSALKVCSTLVNLLSLGLRDCKVSKSGIQHLQNLKKLRCLDLGETQVKDDVVGPLMKIKALRSLLMDETKVTQKTLNELAKLPHLNWIASHQLTVKEWIRRLKTKEFDAANELSPVGLQIPEQGKYSGESINPLNQEQNRFRVELHWEVAGRAPTDIFAKLQIDRGIVKIIEMGISQ